MIIRHQYHGGVWVDLERPSAEEIQQIAEELGIGKLIEKEILSPTLSPLVAADENATLLILHFPSHGAEDGYTKNQEIDFIVGERFIVTVRYEVIAPLYHLQKLLEAEKLLNGREEVTTDILLEVLFAHLYTAVRDHTNHIASRLERVERDMFEGRERTTVRAISNVNREFLHVEAALANQEEPLDRFLKTLIERAHFGLSFFERTEHIRAERAQIARLVTTHRAVATELRETNTALLEARQNEIMKTLTVVTFIMLPLELLTLIFGMHELGTPLENNPNAFWIILTAMLAVVGFMTLFFAKKRWIF
jgi:magnesium transporter